MNLGDDADRLAAEARARIFHFPAAATLAKTLRGKDQKHPTWRGKVREGGPWL